MASQSKRIAAAVALASVLAASAEGLRQTAYYDPPGVLTVCYGHTGNVDPTKRYSLAECKQLLNDDMLKAVAAVERCHPGLPEKVLVAFSDAVFNLGPAIACDRGRSTAARLLAVKDYAGACRQLLRWNKARVGGVLVELPGLTKRRQVEMKVCLEGLQ